jgi:hypothetical protein
MSLDRSPGREQTTHCGMGRSPLRASLLMSVPGQILLALTLASLWLARPTRLFPPPADAGFRAELV